MNRTLTRGITSAVAGLCVLAVMAVEARAAGGALLAGSSAGEAHDAAHSRQQHVDKQVRFILDRQSPGGAIRTTDHAINPYFANQAALGLLHANTPESRTGALRWLQWTLDNLNEDGDHDGLTYTIDDHHRDPLTDEERRSASYDSVDSYAATTLSLAWAAYENGDPRLRALVAGNIDAYASIARLLIDSPPHGVRAPSGLTWASLSWRIEYTLDNAEVVAGLDDFARLQSALGQDVEAKRLAHVANVTRQAMIGRLWRGDVGSWDWAAGHSSVGGDFYPAGMAQYWPVLLHVVSAGSPEGAAAWEGFTRGWPAWSEGNTGQGSPVTSLAVAAQQHGLFADAERFVEDIHARFEPDDWSYPTSCLPARSCGYWHPGEAGWMILALLP